MMKKNKRWRRKQIPERHSLSFMMNREQLCGAYLIKCQEVPVFPWRWRTNMRCRRNQIGERHSLYLMMKTNYAVQKISNAAKAKSIIDDNEQFCSADQMSSLSLTMNNSSAMQNYFMARRHRLSLRRRAIMWCLRYHMLGSTVHR